VGIAGAARAELDASGLQATGGAGLMITVGAVMAAVAVMVMVAADPLPCPAWADEMVGVVDMVDVTGPSVIGPI